jgi:hypothetical protein
MGEHAKTINYRAAGAANAPRLPAGRQDNMSITHAQEHAHGEAAPTPADAMRGTGGHMTGRAALQPLSINGIEARPAGSAHYDVRVAATHRSLGGVRVCDDGRYEAVDGAGGFAGVHKTLSEALQRLADN